MGANVIDANTVIYNSVCDLGQRNTTMSRMKTKVERAEQIHRMKPWDGLALSQQCKFAIHLLDSKCVWPRKLAAWTPESSRPRGRPRLRWDDAVNQLCRSNFGIPSWLQMTTANSIELTRLSASC